MQPWKKPSFISFHSWCSLPSAVSDSVLSSKLAPPTRWYDIRRVTPSQQPPARRTGFTSVWRCRWGLNAAQIRGAALNHKQPKISRAIMSIQENNSAARQVAENTVWKTDIMEEKRPECLEINMNTVFFKKGLYFFWHYVFFLLVEQLNYLQREQAADAQKSTDKQTVCLWKRIRCDLPFPWLYSVFTKKTQRKRYYDTEGGGSKEERGADHCPCLMIMSDMSSTLTSSRFCPTQKTHTQWLLFNTNHNIKTHCENHMVYF